MAPCLLSFIQSPDNLQLRPAPPPEAIQETSWPWWPFLILVFLGLVVVIIRVRSRRVPLSPEKLLEQAINRATEAKADLSTRYLQLQKQLCLYLSERCHTRWRTLTSQQIENEWEQLCSDADNTPAQQIVESWKNAEFIEFGRGSVQQNQLNQLVELANTLLAKQTQEKQAADDKQ